MSIREIGALLNAARLIDLANVSKLAYPDAPGQKRHRQFRPITGHSRRLASADLFAREFGLGDGWCGRGVGQVPRPWFKSIQSVRRSTTGGLPKSGEVR